MKNKMKRTIAFAAALMMAVSLIPASPVAAKTKYKTVKEDGKQYIIFGSYEQDGNEENGKEPIEWEVLGEDKNGILVVSKYILDCQPYNKTYKIDVVWQNCTLRKWLNKKFYKTAFNAKEQKKINTVKVKNADNQYWGTESGSNTNDKIFCLSFDEILKFYEFNTYYDDLFYGWSQNLIALPTQYAKKKDVVTYDITRDYYEKEYKGYGYSEDCIMQGGVFWWLRSAGIGNDYACVVRTDGSSGTGNFYQVVTDALTGVRPAMYLKK